MSSSSSSPQPVIILIDNGSVFAPSILNLRSVAAKLSERMGLTVHPVSYLHSNKVPEAELGGQKARIITEFLHEHLEAGVRDFVILPFFFALGAVFQKVEAAVERKRSAGFPDLRVRYAPSLVDLEGGSLDVRVASIIAKRVAETLMRIEAGEGAGGNDLGVDRKTPSKPTVILLDHGSPLPHMVHLRNYVAGQLSTLLHLSGTEVSGCVAASMERREGSEYDFAEPLLEDLLVRPPFNSGDVVVAMMFLSPGRHAGKGGDVEEICRKAKEKSPGLRSHLTDLVGTHDDVLAVLEQNLKKSLLIK